MSGAATRPSAGDEREALSYFAAFTDGPATLRRVAGLIDAAGPRSADPLAQLLLTPIQLGERTLAAVRDLREERGLRVCFDSGGYYVQIGRIAYDALYRRLLDVYRVQQWADVYVLPDNVPTSRDTEAQVWAKIRQTVQVCRLFFAELPPRLQERAMPVVHGRTIEQANYCLEAYLDMGARQVGFGSFGTAGKNDGVNIAHASAVEVARWVIGAAGLYGAPVHLFGLGVPALVAMIAGLGARTFDSSAWLKSAGFGQVTLPFSRAYNITYRSARSSLQRGILWEEFVALKERIGHDCPYCAEYETLAASKWHRAVHNLFCLTESVAMINAGEHDRIHAIFAGGSPKYRLEASRWLPK
jgi:hypothetical protein